MIYLSILLNLIFGCIGYRIATGQKRNPWLGFALGILLGVWGILILFMLPNAALSFSLNKKPSKPLLSQKEKFFFNQEKHTKYFWYYLNEKQESQGAFSFKRLEELYTAKKVLTSTYVWNESLPEWKTLKEMMEKTTSLP